MQKRIIIILFILFSVIQLKAQGTAASRQFWVSYFGMNTAAAITSDPTLQQFFILISSKTGCTGTISNPNTGYVQSFTVASGSVQKVYIPFSEVYNHSDNDSVFVANKGAVVTTSDSASVYLGNYETSSYDASAVFPLKSLGVSYRIVNTNHKINYYDYQIKDTLANHQVVYRDTTITYDNTGAIIVVATEDNTQLKFNLASTIISNGVTYNAHTDYYTTLNKGQTFSVVGLALLGSTFESENCKKIAVFSGNYCSNVPATCNSCDLLVEQMPPVNTWGKEFLVKSTIDRTKDSRIYIVPDQDNTLVMVKQNGVTSSSTLNAGELLDLNSELTGTKITASKAISVTQYAMGVELAGLGDPMMMWINSVEQMVKEVLFAATPSTYVVSHYVEIFTKTSYAGLTVLDGVNIGSSFSPFVPDSTYSVARIKITPTTHVLKNPAGFLGYVYGYDSGANNTQESYGYSLNYSFYNVQDYFSLDDNTGSSSHLYYNTTDSTNVYIPSDTITISRNIQSDFVSVSWLLNNKPYTVSTETSQAQFSWKLPATALTVGENSLTMIIIRSCETDTIQSTLWLRNATMTLSNAITICIGEEVKLQATSEFSVPYYYWLAKSDTLDEHSNTLILSPTSTTTYYVYSVYGSYQTAIDSVTVLVLQKNYTTLYDTIPTTLTYSFNGETLTQSGTYQQTLTAANGCDSIVTLHLVVKEIDVVSPQVFTPNGDGVNDYFEIKDLDKYPDNTILIFNRWGNKVFEAKPYHNDWDGRNHFGIKEGGNQLPVGTYFYLLNLGDGSPVKKGYLYLNR